MSDDLDPTLPLSPDATVDSGGSRDALLHFSVGEVIADRYRVLRVAGEGGMGVVYEVEDLDLQERVALKTLHAAERADEQSMGRLRREVQLARRVTHPNVCRTYDVGYHQSAGGQRVIFVTMELLRGETLAHSLTTRGRLGEDEAALIVKQLCAGLDAAHEAGVVHRDFKSANVMLVQRGESGSGGLRAVITDFGLARASDPGSHASRSGHIVGTPAYMAPEQVERGEVSPRTDLYALGVVAFEMLSGTQPFEGDLFPTLVQRIKQDAPSIRERVPTVTRKWEYVIARCLERDPRKRFARASDVARALESDPPRRVPLAAGIALAVICVAIAAIFLVTRRNNVAQQESATARPIARRRAAAILGFRNLSQQQQSSWLSTALAEMLGTELAATETVRLVPGEEVARAKQDLALKDVESHSAATLAKLQRALGADLVVAGSYVVIPGGQLRLDVRVQDTKSGETITAFQSTGTEGDLFALVSNAGAQLRDRLGAHAQLAGGVNLRRAVPVNVDAARAYAEGVARLRQFDARGAQERLEAAVKADPLFALAHAQLAQAYSILGYDARAVEHSHRALELSAALPRGEKLLVEARDHQFAGRLDQAIARWRTLVQLFPDDPEARVGLIASYISASRGKEALAAVDQMRSAFANEPRIDLLESWSTEIISDYRRMLASADRAIAKARAVGNRNVLSEALLMRANALANLSQFDAAISAFDEADELFAATGDRNALAKSLRKRSFIAWRRGDFGEARRLTERALAIYRETGQKLGTANAIGILGAILEAEGEYRAARQKFEQALVIYREIGDRQNQAWALSSIAGTLTMTNEPARAEALYEQSLAIAREIGDADQIASTSNQLANLAYQRGELAEADRRFIEARALYEAGGDRSSVADVDLYRGEIALARDDKAGAKAMLERALAVKRELAERSKVGDVQLALAELALESGDAASALSQASAAASSYDVEGNETSAATAWALVAEAHRASGRSDLAQAGAKKATELAAKVEDPSTRARVEITAARVAGDRNKLRALVDRTSRDKLRAANFAARFALAELQHDRAAAAALERDARAAGFALIARKAAALR